MRAAGERPRVRVTRAVTAGLAGMTMMALVAACGGGSAGSSGSGTSSGSSGSMPGKGKPAIVLGDKNFDEELVLGQLYAQAFEAKGYTVQLKDNIGGSELINKVFQSGKINAYPEYLGEIVSSDLGSSKPMKSEAETEQYAQSYEQQHGATIMTPVTPFYNTDELITLKPFAQQHHLASIGQLKSAGQLKLGDYAPEQTRYEGYVGMQQAYGVHNLQFVPLAQGSPIYNAVNSGQVQVGDAFSTDPQLLTGKYTVLSDPQNIFGFQHVGMVINAKVLKQEGPAFQQTYQHLNNLLTTAAMQAMNKAVSVDKQPPAAVAKSFLQANHLLG